MNWLQDEELEELAEVLQSVGVDDEGKQRFQITDLSSLNWALRKLSTLDKRHNEDLALCNAEIHRITKWYEKQDASYQGNREFLEGLVKEFAKQQRTIDPKWKQKTPYGVVSFRKSKKYDYGDEEKLVKYLTDNGMGEFVKVVKTPIKAELKKALSIKDGKAIFTSTGEILPEIVVEETEDVTIKLEG